MYMKILKEEKDSMEIEINDLTMASFLAKYLNMDERVDIASFRQEHPLKETVTLFFKVKEGDPKKILKETLKRMESDVKELRDLLLNSLE
jgi:DNA-directed RNA polymerase subunit L